MLPKYDGVMVPNDASLPVVETFHSLQGEGVHTGRSAFFIRLGGCSVGCSWCDTKHSWPEGVHPRVPLRELSMQANEAVAQGAAFVVITGGEPLHHNLSDVCAELRQQTSLNRGQPVPLHLETSGVDPLSGLFDWITLSPKRHKLPAQQLLGACDELKVVVHGEEDLAFAEQMAASTQINRHEPKGSGPALLLQPGADCPEGERLAIHYVKAHPQWRLSLQTHKLLGVR
jgi:7-carboxy-7-deazaguanine synthase